MRVLIRQTGIHYAANTTVKQKNLGSCGLLSLSVNTKTSKEKVTEQTAVPTYKAQMVFSLMPSSAVMQASEKMSIPKKTWMGR